MRFGQSEIDVVLFEAWGTPVDSQDQREFISNLIRADDSFDQIFRICLVDREDRVLNSIIFDVVAILI